MADNTRTIIAGKLGERLEGKVLTAPKILKKYATDQSIYAIEPLLVASPASIDDLEKIIHFAAEEGVPLTPRGGGSGTAGSALGSGIVIAPQDKEFLGGYSGFTTRNNVPFIRTGSRVYHNDLQEYLRERGFFLPADVSSAWISQIGGNISTKASGPHALKYGSIDRYLESIEFFTARGELVNTADEQSVPDWIKSGLAKLASSLNNDQKALSILESRKNFKTSSGYNLFPFIEDCPLSQLVTLLFAGSGGTLGYITGATLRGEIYDPARAVMLLYFTNLFELGKAASAINKSSPAAMEFMNKETVQLVRQHTNGMDAFAKDAHMLLVEFEGKDCHEQLQLVEKLIHSGGYSLAMQPATAIDKDHIDRLWQLRKQILPFIRGLKPPRKALAVVNDIGVPPVHLPNLIKDIQEVFQRHAIEAMMYGHAGNGNLHLRPLFDVSEKNVRNRIKQVADEVYETVFRYGGTAAGEHGTGRLKAPYLEHEWGKNVYGYMKEVKKIFDPDGVFNPGVMFSDKSIMDDIQDDLFDW